MSPDFAQGFSVLSLEGDREGRNGEGGREANEHKSIPAVSGRARGRISHPATR